MEAKVSGAEAASRLGVNPSRVRAMVRARLLDGSKIGGRWLIDLASIERRRSAVAPVGRDLAPRNAWALLFLVDGEHEQSEAWLLQLSPYARSRIRSRLHREGLAPLVPRLRKRASILRLRAHPSDVARIGEEPGVVRGGVSAASDYDIDISAPGVLEGYVSRKHLPKLLKKYYLETSTNPNVILHIVEDCWPFSASSKVVPASVAAIDLIEAEDERSRRAGYELLERLQQR